MKRSFRVLAAAGLVLLAAPSAHACGQCVAALVWTAFPPLLVWGWVGLVWFVTLSVLSAVWKRKIHNVPRPLSAVVLAIVATLAYAMMGPLVVLALGAAALTGWLALLREERRVGSECPLLFRVLTYTTSGTAVALIVFTGAREFVTPTPRGPTEIVLRWGGTSSGSMAFAKLKEQEPRSADAYRVIVRKGWGYLAGEAAKRLAVVGDAEKDVPPIIDALERFQGLGKEYDYEAHDIGEALREFTGFSLPKEAPAAKWRSAWAEKETVQTEQDR